MKKYLRNERGLTLVEMLATLVILAIIATIAAVAIGNIIQNSKDKAVLADALSIIEGAKIAYMDGQLEGNADHSIESFKEYVEGVNINDSNIKVYIGQSGENSINDKYKDKGLNYYAIEYDEIGKINKNSKFFVKGYNISSTKHYYEEDIANALRGKK